MKRILLILVLIGISQFGFSQVGINTTSPNAQLDIKSSNQATPANNDGILIPKIDAFPITNPTAAQNSMLVYLTNDLPGKPKGFYYWDNNSTSWMGFKGSVGWDTIGNSGTNPATNFIGTTDNNPLNIRVNNIRTGLLEPSIDGNVFFGHEAGLNNTGDTSIGIGYQSLKVNESDNNIGLGYSTLALNRYGSNNIALGYYSQKSNMDGSSNIGIGIETLYSNMHSSNIAIGKLALHSNGNLFGGTVFTSNNIAIGDDALFNNVTSSAVDGVSNTAIGHQSLNTNASGSNNTALGFQSGNANTTGSNNITLGANSNVPAPAGNDQISIGNVIYGTTMSTTALGKIGIGEMAPSEKLQVAGNIKVGSAAWSSALDNKYLKFGDGDYATIGEEASDDRMSFKAKDFIFNPSPIGSYTGNVGIGVLVPTEKLEVAGKTKTTNIQVTTGAALGSVLFSDAVGNGTWALPSSIASGTLDQAYDFGGAGLGNIINADAGAVTIAGVDGFVSTGTYGSGADAPTGAGTRMVWYPKKAAFRAGKVNGTEWDDVNIGKYSAAFGGLSTALGGASTAFGYNTAALANCSTAVGVDNTARSYGETVLGIAATTYTPNLFGGIVPFATDRLLVVGNALDDNSNGLFDDAERSDALVILKNGNTGIGNSKPNVAKLQVQGAEGNTVATFSKSLNSQGVSVVSDSPGIYFNSYYNGGTRSMAGSGFTSILNTNQGTGGFIFQTTDVVNPASGSIVASIPTRMTIEGNGNVGIGAPSPTEKLEVAGKTKTTNLQVTTGATAGKVLTSDATGNATWQVPTAPTAWSLTGNAGTNPATNFIGTTDDVSLNFRVNNITAGKIERLNRNSFYGYNAAGSMNATAFSNTAVGYEALLGSTTIANNTGSDNSCFGYWALRKNSTGSNNLAYGNLSLGSNTTGSGNLAFGNYAMSSITEGSFGITIGHFAMFYFSGPSGPFTNTNTAIGTGAMRGEHFGSLPGSNNTGLRNTVLGYNVLDGISSGNDNTITGFEGSFLNKTGSNNTGFGSQTLYNNVAGNSNVALGYQAGYNETGSNKLYIENSNSTTPLIYGEFDNDLIRINGKTEGIYTQLTANGDGQNSIYALRRRDSQNDGTGYSIGSTNNAIAARNLYGDLYTFGVAGYSDNDFNRTGGVLGGCFYLDTYWGSLGYKSSATTPYGVYASATNTFASGAGRMAAATENQPEIGVGGGFYGGIIGSWSKGTIGSISSGNIFASYNSGDEYTSGKQIEIVETEGNRTAAYTVTSTEIIVYKKGKVLLINGSARVNFDAAYISLLGDIPAVTATPMGECNGLYIASVDKSGFTIKEINNGSSNVSVSWIAVGDRVDANSKVPLKEVLDPDFDNNINEVMFNENNTGAKAKGIWSESGKIHFGEIPNNHISKPIKEIPESQARK